MTLRNFPPADQCSAEDLDAIADLVVSEPRASYDLAGSREHIEALCRRYQAMAQDLSAISAQRDNAQRDAGKLFGDIVRELEQQVAAATNKLDEARDDIEDLKVCAANHRAARTLLGETASDLLDDLGSARTETRALQDTLAAERNERQAEVLQAANDRERADAAEALVEVHEAIARSALAVVTRTAPVGIAELVHAVDGRLSRALVREKKIAAALSAEWEAALVKLEAIQQTHALDEQLRSTCRAVTGQTIETVNIQLDTEIAAHPDTVCATCRDTHSMTLGDREVMCTRCPTPCEHCRSKPQGAFCATTPCACGCHGPDYPRPPGPLHHARDMRDHQEDTTP